MKTIYAIITSIATSTTAAAAVSTNNIVLSTNPGFGSDYALTVYQNSQATDPTSIYFDYTAEALIFVTSNIDEGSDWYLAAPGSVFSASTIISNEFLTFVKSDFGGVTKNPIDFPAGTIFLGVNTGSGFSGTGPDRRFFGWVELESNGSTLSLVESVITYDMPGIIVGTTTTIPEPSTTGFVFASACFLGVLLRRRKH